MEGCAEWQGTALEKRSPQGLVGSSPTPSAANEMSKEEERANCFAREWDLKDGAMSPKATASRGREKFLSENLFVTKSHPFRTNEV